MPWVPPPWGLWLDATRLGDRVPVPPCGSCRRVPAPWAPAPSPEHPGISGARAARPVPTGPTAPGWLVSPWDPWLWAGWVSPWDPRLWAGWVPPRDPRLQADWCSLGTHGSGLVGCPHGTHGSRLAGIPLGPTALGWLGAPMGPTAPGWPVSPQDPRLRVGLMSWSSAGNCAGLLTMLGGVWEKGVTREDGFGSLPKWVCFSCQRNDFETV